MIDRPLTELVDAGWADALAPVAHVVRELGERLGAETAAGRPFLPAPELVLRAFAQPLADVRVLIVGQDPYPTPGHPIGLSFAVERHVRPLPRSLQNIYRELRDDLGLEPAPHGDLSAWSAQGVLLLNRVLTVGAGAPASHRGWGWEQVSEAAIRALVARRGADGGPVPLVAILWGAQAQALAPLLEGVPIIASAHPSPLSASRGFFGSRPFSRANAALEAQGAAPVDWRIRSDDADRAVLDATARRAAPGRSARASASDTVSLFDRLD
ncbi:uracil-DNA glycosylase [Agrococcus beijingensis]|uniref:uracil-DNA glycosylase n=1 Tax=Agrococcus beijingensis TaxID=3068634 RepID=UPI002741C191|nr:uracil-DNA glycosylase [Agrococcus sp. REN33]